MESKIISVFFSRGLKSKIYYYNNSWIVFDVLSRQNCLANFDEIQYTDRLNSGLKHNILHLTQNVIILVE